MTHCESVVVAHLLEQLWLIGQHVTAHMLFSGLAHWLGGGGSFENAIAGCKQVVALS
jgi:hypothetical protein